MVSRVRRSEGGRGAATAAALLGLGGIRLVEQARSTVSHHLKQLKEAGLLASERRGTWVYYRVEPSVVAAMGQMLGQQPGQPTASKR